MGAYGIGGTGSDLGKAIIANDAGEFYTTGIFQDTVDFDPGNGVYNFTSAGVHDFFVQKMESCNTPSPVANFSYTGTQPTFVFTDLSTASPSQWAWDFGDGATSTSQNPTHTYTNPGQYNVCLAATNACGSDSTCQAINVLTATTTQGTTACILYPNPSAGTSWIETQTPARFELNDMQGRTLQKGTLPPGKTTLNFHNHASGPYLIKIFGETTTSNLHWIKVPE